MVSPENRANAATSAGITYRFVEAEPKTEMDELSKRRSVIDELRLNPERLR
jgi:hypothetical protein